MPKPFILMDVMSMNISCSAKWKTMPNHFYYECDINEYFVACSLFVFFFGFLHQFLFFLTYCVYRSIELLGRMSQEFQLYGMVATGLQTLEHALKLLHAHFPPQSRLSAAPWVVITANVCPYQKVRHLTHERLMLTAKKQS